MKSEPIPSNPDDIKDEIRSQANALGFDAVGFAPVTLNEREKQRLQDFVAAGHHGDMGWMEGRLEQRSEPKGLWPDVASVITLGTNYGPSTDPMAVLEQRERAAISVYAQNQDYHNLIKKRLKALARWMVARYADTDVKVFVDTAPVMEKAVAAKGGLGWQGKHTNLVSRAFGSWLFLGEVFTTLSLPPDSESADHCGRCTDCQTVCPTDAFPEPYKLDASRCISYLTIEHKGVIPLEFREPMGNRIYGCDDCLAICPWNKFTKPHDEQAFSPRADLNGRLLVDFLTLDDAGFRALFRKSPVKRIGRDRFLRNVLIAIGNSQNEGAVDNIIPLLDDASPLVRGMAVWALSKLTAPAILAKIRKRYFHSETDKDVKSEWAFLE